MDSYTCKLVATNKQEPFLCILWPMVYFGAGIYISSRVNELMPLFLLVYLKMYLCAFVTYG